MTKNISPLRYPGGKTRACKILDKILVDYFEMKNVKTVISPFFGGGSFEFFIQNKYNLNIIANDKFTQLYSFWNCCKNNQLELYQKLIETETITKEKFTEYREKIITEPNELQQAYYYFVINRCSFSGATLSGGFSKEASQKRFTKSSIEKIKSLNLENMEISNDDFEKFLNDKHDGLIFLDPPYYLGSKSKLYGNNGDLHETFDHQKLQKILETKTNWMMTYNNCDYIKKLYEDCLIIETSWTYGMNKTKESSEIVIIKKS